MTHIEDDRDDATDGTARRGTDIHIGIGLRPVTDLIGGLLGGVAAPVAPDPGAEFTDRTDGPAVERERHVEVRRDGGTVTVVADLPGVEAESLTIGLDERTGDLVVGVDEAIVERVSLPWRAVLATEVTFNNGVLTVVLREDDETRER